MLTFLVDKMQARMSGAWARCMINDGVQPPAKLCFDRWTVAVGIEQRGWIVCPMHKCRRYRYCKDFSSREGLAANSFAWLQSMHRAEVVCRETHLSQEPTAAEIANIHGRILVNDF